MERSPVCVAMKPDCDDRRWLQLFSRLSPRRRRDGKHPQSFSERYKLGDTIGEGANSTVRLATDRATGQEWACKVITNEQEREFAEREVQFLRKLHHPNLLRFREHFVQRDGLYIVTECLRGPDLLTDILDLGRYSEGDARLIMAQLLSVMAYLHDNAVVHRDIKLENVVLARDDGSLDLCLIDLGFAEDSDKKPRQGGDASGTPLYAAPELLGSAAEHGAGLDVWAAGVLLYALLSGRFPFFGKSMDDLRRAIISSEPCFDGPVWDSVSDCAKSMVRRMLARDPTNRPTSKDLLRHPWLRGKERRCSA